MDPVQLGPTPSHLHILSCNHTHQLSLAMPWPSCGWQIATGAARGWNSKTNKQHSVVSMQACHVHRAFQACTRANSVDVSHTRPGQASWDDDTGLPLTAMTSDVEPGEAVRYYNSHNNAEARTGGQLVTCTLCSAAALKQEQRSYAVKARDKIRGGTLQLHNTVGRGLGLGRLPVGLHTVKGHRSLQMHCSALPAGKTVGCPPCSAATRTTAE